MEAVTFRRNSILTEALTVRWAVFSAMSSSPATRLCCRRRYQDNFSYILPVQTRDPAVLQEALQQEQRGREQARPGDFKAHITALHDSRIETEAQRIVDKLKDLSAPNSPNKTHFMVEISPHFDALASTKDNDRLFAMLPYKSLCFTGIKDRHGVYAMIGKDERRDVSIRRPRPSIRKQLTDSKQAASPKKAAARTKKKELEV